MSRRRPVGDIDRIEEDARGLGYDAEGAYLVVEPDESKHGELVDLLRAIPEVARELGAGRLRVVTSVDETAMDVGSEAHSADHALRRLRQAALAPLAGLDAVPVPAPAPRLRTSTLLALAAGLASPLHGFGAPRRFRMFRERLETRTPAEHQRRIAAAEAKRKRKRARRLELARRRAFGVERAADQYVLDVEAMFPADNPKETP